MKTFRFLDWQVYNDSKKLLNYIAKLINKLPNQYKYEIGNQLIRSTLSISLNIAEGSGKNSDKEFNRFIEIALGSVYETVACLDILKDNNLITKEESEFSYILLGGIARQLGGLKKKIKKDLYS